VRKALSTFAVYPFGTRYSLCLKRKLEYFLTLAILLSDTRYTTF
jgi:hypothetical protein